MARTGSIKRFEGLVVSERAILQDLHSPSFNRDLQGIRVQMQGTLKDIGAEGRIEDILLTEKIIALSDRKHFANSKAMKSSLDTTIMEIGIAGNLLRAVNIPDEYQAIAKAYEHPRDLRNGVPVDNARKFFKSQASRLLNMGKTRLSDEEKGILDVRRGNLRVAAKVYEALQRDALSLPSQEQKQGTGTGM